VYLCCLLVKHHLHCLLSLTGNCPCLHDVVDHLKYLVLSIDLVLLFNNLLWVAIIVQDVMSLRIGADEGSVLNSGKAEAGGEVDVAAVVEDDLEDGDEEAEEWDWQEVKVLLQSRMEKEREGDLICSRVEDEVGECVLDCGVDAVGAVGEEEKREQGEEEAEDWDWDKEDVELKVPWNPSGDPM